MKSDIFGGFVMSNFFLCCFSGNDGDNMSGEGRYSREGVVSDRDRVRDVRDGERLS